MLHNIDSSESSDDEPALFTGRHKPKKLHRSRSNSGGRTPSYSPFRDVDTTQSLKATMGNRSLGGSFEEEGGGVRRSSLGSQRRASNASSGGNRRSSLQPQGSYRREDLPLGSPSDSRQGSRQGSPLPADLGDYVVISKEKHADKRSSGTEFDWTPIAPSGDEYSGGEGEGGGGEGRGMDPEDLEQKKLYLLVSRCIAFPFNAKYQIETTPPRTKLNDERFKLIYRILKATVESTEREGWDGDSKLTNQEKDVIQGQGFLECVRYMLQVVLVRPDVVQMCNSGSFSVKELESIFKVKATITLSVERGEEVVNTRSTSPEVMLWCTTFRKIIERCSHAFLDHSHGYQHSKSTGSAASAAMLSQDKLYKIFQEILKIKSIEHQVLYKECKLGSPEEQEAVVRRELQARKKLLENASFPLLEGKFGSHKVEAIYREEQLKMLKLLINNLDQLSLQESNITTRDKTRKKGNVSESGSAPVAKQDLHFSLKVKVTIHEVTDLHSSYEGKALFCVFDVADSGRDAYQTQPGGVEYSGVSFGEEGEFWISSPMPQVKLELRSVSKSIFSDSKLIAKHTHTALPSSSDVSAIISLYQSDKKDKDCIGKLRVSTIVERPTSIKKCGYMASVGDSMFKQKKKRFFTLIQLSEYKFLFCCYQPGGTQPKESLQLDQGMTVEYTAGNGQLQNDVDAKYLFDLVFDNSELGRVHFGCRDDVERQSWIEWMVRGTGQTNQPQQLGVAEVIRAGSTDLERYGLQEVVISVNDHLLEPHKLFIKLFRATLEWRLNEDLFSRGLFSPAQMYVLDEFCARYGVRDPFRHLTCLQDWLDHMERGVSIWPVMIQSSFCFCQMHIGGMNPPEKSVIVTSEEREVFVEVCQRIEEVVSHQLLNFRTCFPFCCPKGDLRTTLKLFDLVTSINHSSHTGAGSPQAVLTLIMEKGALINYKQVYNTIQKDGDVDAPLHISKLFELAQLCIKFMYELHDFFWEEFNQAKVFFAHINAFWSFFMVDMKESIAFCDDMILKLQLFHIVNNYFSSQPTMRLEDYHQEFLNCFTPVVLLYIDTLEQSLRHELTASLAQETWLPMSIECCGAVKGMMKSLLSFKRFLQELNWPEGSFAAFLDQKVAAIAADRFQEAAEVIQFQLGNLMVSGKGSMSLTYSLPPEFFTMINTLVYLSSQVMQVCAAQRIQIQESQIESSLEHGSTLNIVDHLSSILDATITMAISKLCNPLQDIFIKLNKFDPSDGFLASLKMMIPTIIPITAYTEFLTSNLALISTNLVTTIFNNFVVNWYECQMQLLSKWLEKRPEFSLHKTQLTSAEQLFKTLYVSFVACEVPPRQLRSQSHNTVDDRIQMETSHIDLLSVGKD